ncbi:hypothetical protein DFH08DRAFT_948237 [Mycena albidolilacea]|uniref:Uncharacterized protein n=1 Tax=Mycena albidolilacea TaxID=1033008 RepID=A0AAD7AQK9_9AGAR|nr:hypothetical protein DFH08DRAFT_948237 [Mycena albidolilacea]
MDARHAIRRRRAQGRGRALLASSPVVEIVLLRVLYPSPVVLVFLIIIIITVVPLPTPPSPTPRARRRPLSRRRSRPQAVIDPARAPSHLPNSRAPKREQSVLRGARGACNFDFHVLLLAITTVVAALALRTADAPRGLVDALDGPAVGDARGEVAVQDGEGAGVDVCGRVYVPAG